MGHSAGAVHVAGYVSHPEFYKAKGGGVAGAIMLSGIYDLTATTARRSRTRLFRRQRLTLRRTISLQGLLTTKIPLMVAAAELDPPGFVKQFDLLKEAACKRASGCAHAMLLPQHNHMSEVYSINTADDRLTNEILDFVKTAK